MGKKSASHDTAGKRKNKIDWLLIQLTINIVQVVILIVWILFLLLYVIPRLA